MNDVVIAVVRGYDWAKVRTFANSLVRSGFSGEKVMFVNSVTEDLRGNLKRLGFTVIDADIAAPPAFFMERYKPVVSWLAENHQRFRYVIWAGPRDVLFQTDPTLWLEKNLTKPRIVAAGEGWAIKNESYNDGWIRTMFPEQHNRLRENEVLCADTICGSSLLMFEFLRYMEKLMVGASPLGMDQAVLNYTLRMADWAPLSIIPQIRDGYIATWYPEKANDPAKLVGYDTDDGWKTTVLRHGVPVFSAKDGIVYTPDGKTPYSIVHQYDRCSVWRELMEMKYEKL